MNVVTAKRAEGTERVAVVGCGAIGGVVAANLSRAGVRVTPITGNATVATALAQHGYRVRELDGSTWSTPVTATPLVAVEDADGQPDRDGALYDVCIVATQSTRLEAALESLRHRLAPDGVVVCCQNGLPEERAAKLVGRARVVGAVVGWGASMWEPGLYARTSRGGFQLGRPWRDDDEAGNIAVARVAALLGTWSDAHAAENFAGVRWSKLAINCCTTTLGAIGGDALGPLLRQRFVRRLALEVFAEVACVAARAGVRPTPVGGTFDIASIAITDDERARRLGSPSLFYKHSLLFAVGLKYRRMRSSMLYAIERGRPTEIDFLNGELVRLGATLGIATPVNQSLVDEVRAIVGGTTRPGVDTLRTVHARLGHSRLSDAPLAS